LVAAAAIIIAIACGMACGGSIRGLQEINLRFEVPVLVLFVAQGVARGRLAGTSASAFGLVVWVTSCLLLLVLVAPDWRRPGVWVVGTGLAANLLVVMLNGGMPITVPGWVSMDQAATSIARSVGFYALAGPGTLLAGLGDVVLLAIGSYRILASPGDVLLALGVSALIVDAMLTHPDGHKSLAGQD
jgi:hypothetical protein